MSLRQANTSSFSAGIMLGLRTQFRSTLTGAVGKTEVGVSRTYASHKQVLRFAGNTINPARQVNSVAHGHLD